MSNANDNLYARAGVSDIRDFYRTKFVSDEVLDERYFKALDRFDIRFARTMWIYDNIRAGSTVLDLGCGAGMVMTSRLPPASCTCPLPIKLLIML